VRQHLQVLIGPVASGKSTYSGNCAKAGMVTVNDDAIVNAMHAGDYQLYDKALKLLYKSVENHAVVTAIGLGRSVVIDRGTNNRPDSRRRWVGLAHSLDLPVVAIQFRDEGPEVHARRRSESDGRGADYAYWLKVARHHRSQFRPVDPSEGFDRVVELEWSEIQSGYCYRGGDL
jgi:predicted kinase